MTYRIENSWSPEPAPAGTLTITLHNLSDDALAGFTLSYTAITRVMPDAPPPENATFLLRDANYHRFAPPEGLALPPGGAWTFRARRPQPLALPPRRRRQDRLPHPRRRPPRRCRGRRPQPVAARQPERRPPGCPRAASSRPSPSSPGPPALDLAPGDTPRRPHRPPTTPPPRTPPPSPPPAPCTAASSPPPAPPSRSPRSPAAARSPSPPTPSLKPAAYRLTFAPTIRLDSADADGRRHGLTALLHLLHGATTEPATFRFPATGTIEDAPRYAWRGCHLDVSRHFWPAAGRPPLPRHPRLVPDERLPLAPDRRRGLALRGPGPAHPHHGRRHPRRRRPAAPAARRPRRHPHPVLHHGRAPRASLPTPPPSASRSSPRSTSPATPPRCSPPFRTSPTRTSRRQLPLGAGLSQQRAQPRDRGHLRRPRPGLRRAGRHLPVAPHPYRRRRGGEELLDGLAARPCADGARGPARHLRAAVPLPAPRQADADRARPRSSSAGTRSPMAAASRRRARC